MSAIAINKSTLGYGAVSMYKPSSNSVNNTPPLQSLADKLTNKYGGGSILLSPGYYLYDGTTPLRLNNVSLIFPSRVPVTYDKVLSNSADIFATTSPITSPMISNGACVFAITGNAGNPNAASPFELINGGCISGVTFYWPNNPFTLTTPIAYPYAVNILHEASIENCGFYNAYKGVLLQGRRPLAKWIFGYFMNEGFVVDKAPDVAKLEHCHCVIPGDGPGVMWDYSKANLTAFTFKRADMCMVSNCFTVFANTGFKFTTGTSIQGLNSPWVVLQNCAADVCNYSVDISASQNKEGIDFSNFHASSYISTIRNSGAAYGSTNMGQVRFNGGNLIAISGNILNNTGGSMIKVSNMALNSYNNNTAVALQLDGGSTIINDCEFYGTIATTAKIASSAKAVFSNLNSPNAFVFRDGSNNVIDINTPPAGTKFSNINSNSI